MLDSVPLDSDEILTAITGPLSGYEYVIATATKPVSAGMQVRLAEDVQQVVLHAAGLVDVPERLPGQELHPGVIVRGLRAKDE